ncbi:unnamed protein product, partial [Symbiodinium sp. CCMP2456]
AGRPQITRVPSAGHRQYDAGSRLPSCRWRAGVRCSGIRGKGGGAFTAEPVECRLESWEGDLRSPELRGIPLRVCGSTKRGVPRTASGQCSLDAGHISPQEGSHDEDDRGKASCRCLGATGSIQRRARSCE